MEKDTAIERAMAALMKRDRTTGPEQEVAAAFLARLMRQNQLTEAMLYGRLADQADPLANMTEKFFALSGRHTPAAWRKYLSWGVQSVTFTKLILYMNKNAAGDVTGWAIGTKQACDQAIWLVNYLIDQIILLGNDAWRERGLAEMQALPAKERAGKAKWLSGFYYGCMQTVYARLQRQFNEDMEKVRRGERITMPDDMGLLSTPEYDNADDDMMIPEERALALVTDRIKIAEDRYWEKRKTKGVKDKRAEKNLKVGLNVGTSYKTGREAGTQITLHKVIEGTVAI